MVAYFALLAIFAYVAPAANAAEASSAVWQDMSYQLPLRANRPVWSMANVNGTLYFTDGQDLTKTGHVWRKIGSGKATDITGIVRDAGLTRVDRVVNNVKDVVFVQDTPGAQTATKYVELYGNALSVGTSNEKSAGFGRVPQITNNGILPKEILDKSQAAYNGKLWLIVTGKNIYATDGKGVKDLGRTRDFFTTVTVDLDGSFWLGGAVSTFDNDQPGLPLTAKLVRLAVNGVSFDADRLQTIVGTSNGTHFWSWTEPSVVLQDPTIATKFSVGSQSDAGLKRIELSADGKLVGACDYTGSKTNETCTANLDGKSFAADANILATAVITDTLGRKAYVPAQIIRFKTAISTANQIPTSTNKAFAANLNPTPPVINDSGVSAWLWAEYDLDLMANRSKTIRTQAMAKNGLAKMEVAVNGNLRRVCAFNGQTTVQACDLAVTGNDYISDTINLNVKATDKLGQSSESDLQMVQSAPQSNGPTLSAWINVAPLSLDMQRIETRTVTAGGDATNGVKKVEILVNNSIVQTCEYYDRTASRACTIAIKGDGPLASMGTMAVNARVTDLNGNSTWSETKVINVTDMKLADQATLNVGFTATPSSQSLLPDQSKDITAAAHGVNGIKQIDIYVNDRLVQTCGANGVINNDKTCGVPLSGKMYNPGAWMTVSVMATDLKGNVAWSMPQTFVIRDYGADPQLDMEVAMSTEPNLNLNGKFADIVTLSQAPFGIQKVLMQADGQPIQACWFGRYEGKAECRATLDLNKKNVGDKVVITAQATDAYGNVKESKQVYLVRAPSATELVKNYLESFVKG